MKKPLVLRGCDSFGAPYVAEQRKAKKAASPKAPPKKRTNADWIRGMTLEELARFLGVWGSGGDRKRCLAVDLLEKPDPEIVAWLEQKVRL